MRRSGVLLLWSILSAGVLAAQATPTVRPDASTYRLVERLAAAGLIDTLILGIRPFSEREVVRLLTEAQRNLGRKPEARPWAEAAISRDLAWYRRDHARFIDWASGEQAFLRSEPRVPSPDGSGLVDGMINPLAAYRGGRPIVDGATSTLETMHAATLGEHVALSLNPRFSLTAVRAGETSADVTLQTAAATFLFGDFTIEAGRDQVIFGQALTGGLLLSTNVPALDMVRLSNDRAWRVPLLSRVFGGIRGSFFIADLGGSHQIHPHPKLVGYHLAGLPSPHFEIGVQVVDAMGGRGGQPASFGDRVLDVIPIVDALRTGSDFAFSNKLAGVDMRWRMPAWRGFELYAEGNADDFDGAHLGRGFKEDAGYIFGTSLACIVQCGRLGVRAEYHQTGIRYYTHTDYPMAAKGLLLGDPLGPRGMGGYLTVDGDVTDNAYFSVTAAFETRSGNEYGAETTGPNDAGFHFVLLARHPSEKRSRLTASWMTPDTRPFSIQVAAGVEHVEAFRFVPGNSRTNFLARIAVMGRP